MPRRNGAPIDVAVAAGPMIILCADDYAISEGVSRGICELAATRRLSATSVLVTSPHWPAAAPALAPHRAHLSIGLHLDLTLGPPLGAMPSLALGGRFPSIGGIVRRALLGRLEPGEMEAEITRQLDAFEAALGFPPDHVDGHQHVQVLPGVRGPLLALLARRYPRSPPLVRNPSDRVQAIWARRSAAAKALGIGALATGFAAAARQHGLPVNDSFSGFSAFDLSVPYAGELRHAMLRPGRRHIVMCHPGEADPGHPHGDRVVERRPMELEALMGEPGLPERIWRPARAAGGPPIPWSGLEL